MLKCKLRLHKWQKRKQWVGKNGPISSKRCHYCGTLKEEGKLIDAIKTLAVNLAIYCIAVIGGLIMLPYLLFNAWRKIWNLKKYGGMNR